MNWKPKQEVMPRDHIITPRERLRSTTCWHLNRKWCPETTGSDFQRPHHHPQRETHVHYMVTPKREVMLRDHNITPRENQILCMLIPKNEVTLETTSSPQREAQIHYMLTPKQEVMSRDHIITPREREREYVRSTTRWHLYRKWCWLLNNKWSLEPITIPIKRLRSTSCTGSAAQVPHNHPQETR